MILIADNTPFAGTCVLGRGFEYIAETGVPTTAPGKSLHRVGTGGLACGLDYIVGGDVHGDP